VDATIPQLTAAMARGDEPAIESFYRRYFDLLYRHARQVSRRDESFCLDIVQEALLRIVRTIRPVPTEPQLVGWLKLVVKSVAYDLLRGERRRQEREAVRGSAPGLFAAGAFVTGLAEDPVAAADARDETADRLAWLRRELLALDPELVRLIELRFLHGWTLARIGALVGLSKGTVDGRLRRALESIRRKSTALCGEPVGRTL
jgi:RNA polymerase sigma factor (sigma-70 family)